MKKFILLGVSLVLLIACLFVGSGAKVSAGPGMGINHKVKDVEELADVLTFLLNEDDDDSDSELLGSKKNGHNIVLLSKDGERTPIKQLSSKKSNKYSSATVNIMSNLSTSSSSEYGSSSQSLDREMTMFITKKATLYQSKGTTNNRSTRKISDDESTSSSTKMDFDIEILRTSGDDVYVNFKNFSCVQSSDKSYYSLQIKYKHSNEWIKMPYELVESLVDVDSQNRELLESFGEILDYLIDSGEIDKDDNYVSLNQADFKKMKDELESSPIEAFALEKGEVEFSYDLTASTSPYISYIMSYSEGSSRVNLSEQFVIRNINNTVVSYDKNLASIKLDDPEDLERIFDIKESKEEDDD